MYTRRPEADVTQGGHTRTAHTRHADEPWVEPPPQPRDIKKILLIFGLGALSWVATYVGMLELIQANMGTLGLGTKVVIGCSVAMLMTMIVWLLDQLFAPLPFTTKLAYVFGYIFLTMISVGFGFGFYWKVLESRSEASRSAESAVTQVQGSMVAAAARLDQLSTTLINLTEISQKKAIEERERGTSCPNSRPGDGPRRRLRDSDAARFSYASNFVSGRLAKIKAELKGLDAALLKITSGDPSTIDPKTGTRNAYLRSLSHKLELTTSRFNAFSSDPQLKQIRTELDKRATTTIFPTGRGSGTFSCPDPQLQTALRGVVRAIDQLPELQKPHIATVEGSEAVIEAFRRLGATFQGALLFDLPPSADEMRELQKKAVRKAENSGSKTEVVTTLQGGLSKRDYIPLAIALFVDLCLLLVSIGRPMNRMDGLVPRMRMAERGPVYQILSKFSDIHEDEGLRKKFEVFRHVVFDFNGDYYVAVPLDAPRKRSVDEQKRLLQEAHLLGNLFASFEKEKIFARVINPLLSTRVIQKKLRRQGSNFADSQAFRVYRFRDGAWSEIILGAIMGASRRASVERRTRILQEGHTLRGAETATPEQTAPAMPSEAGQDSAFHAAEFADIMRNTAGGQAGPVAQAHAPVHEAVQQQRYAHTASAVTPSAPVDPQHARRFGPYASSAARETMSPVEAGGPHAGNTAEYAQHPADAGAGPQGSSTPPRRERIADRLRRERAANWQPDEADVQISSGEEDGTGDNVVPLNPFKNQAPRAPVMPIGRGSDDPPRAGTPADITTPPSSEARPPIRNLNPLAGEMPRATQVTLSETTRTINFEVPTSEASLPPALATKSLIDRMGAGHSLPPQPVETIAPVEEATAAQSDVQQLPPPIPTVTDVEEAEAVEAAETAAPASLAPEHGDLEPAPWNDEFDADLENEPLDQHDEAQLSFITQRLKPTTGRPRDDE